MMEKNMEKTDALAREVLSLSRNTLLVHLRFLDTALHRLGMEAKTLPAPLATDGRTLYYDAQRLLESYRAEPSVPTRDLLHLVLHCVFRHFAAPPEAERAVWDLACDVAVEYAVSGLGLPETAARREQRQKKLYARLPDAGGMTTADKLYHWFLDQRYSPEELQKLRETFYADDHALWQGGAEAETAWRESSRRMQVDLETFARRHADRAGALMLGLREANREISDYAGFLRKLAVRGEPMRLDPDEFDYGLYSYGMRLYDGRVPLIEPLEYRETRRVREFAAAIETTRKFPADLARTWLEKTWDTLAATETHLSGVRMFILIGKRAPVRIESREELDVYLETLLLPETGGEDFRPLFLRMDALVRKRTFQNLRGLLCFTDGYGPFPASMPSYPAAFVFVNDDYSTPAVPAWALRQVLQRNEI